MCKDKSKLVLSKIGFYHRSKISFAQCNVHMGFKVNFCVVRVRVKNAKETNPNQQLVILSRVCTKQNE